MHLRVGKILLALLSVVALVVFYNSANSFAGEESAALQLTPAEKAWLKEHPAIFIGIMDAWPPINFVDGQGISRGIGVDYIRAVNKRLGGVIKLVPRPFKDNLEAVKEKKLDALMDVTPKPEREEFLNFTRPYLNIPHVIIARADGPYLASEHDLLGHTLALEAGFYNVTYFRNKYPSLTIKEYADTARALGAVSRGEADAYVGNRAVAAWIMEQELISNLQFQGRADKPGSILTIGVRKDWPEFASILDKALADLTVEEVREIHRHWTGITPDATKGAKISLTPNERAWISKHTVRTRVSYWPPLMFIEPEPSGIAVDYLKTIAAETGLRIQFVPDTIGWKKSLEDLVGAKEHYDLILTMKRTPEREAMIAITDDYLSLPWVVISRDGDDTISQFQDLRGKTVSVEQGYVMQGKLQHEFPGINLLVTNNSIGAMEAVSTGKADAYVGNLANAKYLMDHHGFYNLKVTASTPFGSHDQAMGVRKDWPELASIINKGLKAISPEQRIAIEQKWAAPVVVATAPSLPEPVQFNQNKFLLQSLGVIFACLAAVILIAWLVRGRPGQLSIRAILFGVLFVLAGLIVSIGVFVIILMNLEKKMADIEANKSKSIRLAYELKQSSDDLTRFARTFTVTGDARYEKYFQDILAIRDGQRPHPKNFTPSYWDHVAAGVIEPDESGETYSIEQRMIDLGLSEQEKEKLSEAKYQSDDLTKLENMAMNAVKGLFRDKNGEFTMVGPPDREMARNIVHGEKYHNAKSKIMKPIDEFFALLEWRTTNELNLVQKKTSAVIMAISTLTIFTIVFAIYTFFLLKRRVITPLYFLKSGATTIEQGDYDHRINISSADEVGNLAAAFNAMASSVKERTTKLRSIIDTAVDGIIVISSSGIVQEFSPAAEKIFGYDAGEVIGQDLSMLMPEPYRSNHGGYLVRYLETSKGRILGKQTESLGLKKNGDVFPVDISVSEALIGDEIYFTGIVRDITDRKQIEEQIKAAREELLLIFDNSQVGILFVQRDCQVARINRRLTDILGYESPKEIIGFNMSQMHLSEKHFNEFKQSNHEILLRGERSQVEYQLKKQDGSAVWCSMSGKALDIDSPPDLNKGVIWVIDDITEQKRAEELLVESQNRLDMALSSSNTGLWDWHPFEGTDYHNDQWYRQLGYNRDEFPEDTNHLMSLMHPEDAVNFNKFVKGYLSGSKDDFKQEFRLKAKDGSWAWILSLGRVTERDETGRTKRIIGVHLDMTERKKAEEELQQNLGELERFNRLVVGRELKMIQLKSEINDLLEQSGHTPKYRIVE